MRLAGSIRATASFEAMNLVGAVVDQDVGAGIDLRRGRDGYRRSGGRGRGGRLGKAVNGRECGKGNAGQQGTKHRR